MDHRQRLRSILVQRSLFLGDFTLASGARSPYYIDARLTTMSAEGQFLIGQVGFATLRERFPEIRWVGGLTLGADPITYAIAHRSWLEGFPVDGFTVRKNPKGHGTGKRIEGGLPHGTPVVVIEDALTSASSALEAIAAVEAHGASVVGVLALVDRGAGGEARLREHSIPLATLFSAAELLSAAGVDPEPGPL
jgi:orotate phosphoribosyltransferase